MFENARVSVWDVGWPQNTFTGMHRDAFDYFGVEVADATFRLTYPERPPRTASVSRGTAWFLARGAIHGEEGLSDPPRRAIIADLLDEQSVRYDNSTAHAAAFPIAGAAPVVDTPRVVMWDYSWMPGRYELPRFYARDVVVIFIVGGELRSSAPGAEQEVFTVAEGQVFFRPGGMVYGEYATTRVVRAIFVELK